MYCLKPQPDYDEVVSQLERFDTRLQTYSSNSCTPTLAYYGERKTNDNHQPRFSGFKDNYRGGRGFGRGRFMSYRGRGSGYTARNSTVQERASGPHFVDQSQNTSSTWSHTGQGFRPYANTFQKYPNAHSYSSQGQVSSKVIQDNGASLSVPLVCQICHRPGHHALRCWYRFDNSYQAEEIPTALTALHIEDSSGASWFPDTGASAHIAATPGILHTSTSYYGSDTVMIGDGSRLNITHVGDTVLPTASSSLPLHDVLIVPHIKKNLLSVSKLTSDYPCSFIFDNTGVYVKDKTTNMTVRLGRKADGLYQVDSHSSQAFFTQFQKHVGAELWHQRLAHTNAKTLQVLQRQALIHCSSSVPAFCSSCQLAKSTALPFPLSTTTSTSPLTRIHCDVWGPSPITSIQHFRFYVIFVDDYTRYSWIYPMKAKSDVPEIFLLFQKLVENQFDLRIKEFQCDGGGEFTSHKFVQHLQQCGIKQQFSCPYTPEQNGVAERKHRHIVELGLALLYHAQVPLTYWVDAFITANYIVNLLPMHRLQMSSPFSKLFKKQASYGHLRVFGCACYPCLRPYASHKLAPRSLQCVFLGYSSQHKGYRCLLPSTGRVYLSRHVVFDETCFPFAQSQSLYPTARSTSPDLSNWHNVTSFPESEYTDHPCCSVPSQNTQSVQHVFPEVLQALEPQTAAVPSDSSPSQVLAPVSILRELPVDSSDDHSTAASTILPVCTSPTSPVTSSAASIHPMQTRLRVGIVKPNPKYACLVTSTIPAEPKSIKSALADPGWYNAMKEEMDALQLNQTWTLVPSQPHMNVIGCKWIFKTKLKSDGTLDRLKARLVAKGFHQEEGLDFTETFSPVVKHATVRIVLSVAMMRHWPIRQLDVKNAFLHGTLNEIVYMHQPPGFVQQSAAPSVCLLQKSLYGLRQAPRAWFEKFSNYLLELGFFCSTADPSLFVLHKGCETVFLLLYVDDIVLTGSSDLLVSHLIKMLSQQFHMKDLGSLHYFLGIEARRCADNLFLCQTKYATDLLLKAHMQDCKPVSTPLAVKSPPMLSTDSALINPVEFRSLVGGLQYLTITRPDIAFATNSLCQHLQHPTQADHQKLHRVLRYIKGTLQLGLTISARSSFSLYGFSDADWAGCVTSRRSTTGYCTFLGSNLLSWSAKRQSTVSRSSTEAEYRALASTTADLTWITFILRDLGVSLSSPTKLFCDNRSAIALIANPILHARTKHIEIDFHFVREKVSSGSLQLCFVPSINQVADVFTKPLTRFAHNSLRLKLGLALPLPNLRGAVTDSLPESTLPESTLKTGSTKKIEGSYTDPAVQGIQLYNQFSVLQD